MHNTDCRVPARAGRSTPDRRFRVRVSASSPMLCARSSRAFWRAGSGRRCELDAVAARDPSADSGDGLGTVHCVRLPPVRRSPALGAPRTPPDHRHIPFPLDRITGITAVLARLVSVPGRILFESSPLFDGWMGALSGPSSAGLRLVVGSGSGLVRRADVQDVSRPRWTTETFLGALPGPAYRLERSASMRSWR
jgi:hypothetical protein